MYTFINLLQGSKSLYGYCQTERKSPNNAKAPVLLEEPDSCQTSALHHQPENISHETLYSLLLSILPSILHKYRSHSDIGDPKEYKNNKPMTILATTLMALQSQAGFNIPEVQSNFESIIIIIKSIF